MIYLKYVCCDDDSISRHKAANVARDFILSRAFGVENASEVIETGNYGKPYIKGAPFDFSVAHTSSLAVAAACGKGDRKDDLLCIEQEALQIGVDIECVDRKLSQKKMSLIAKKMFSPKEREYINAQGICDKTRFLDVWTRKESLIKATGKGLMALSKTDSFDENIRYLKTQHIVVNNKEYIVSLAGM